MNERLKKLVQSIRDYSAEAYISFSAYDIRYFTNIDAEGCMLVSSDQCVLFLSPIYYEQAVDFNNRSVKIAETINGLKDISDFLKNEDIGKIGLDYRDLSAQQYLYFADAFKCINMTDVTKTIRMIKEKEEINTIQRASYAARNAFLKVYPLIQPGVTEKELADELTYQLRKAGAQKEAFETIVASGRNASYPHHRPTDKKVQNGEFLMIDFGAQLDGYNSDTTYTFLIGQKDDEKRELFNAVFHARLFATEMIAPGRTKVKELEERARKELAKYDLDKYFTHSLGHGVGLEVHEFPYVNLKNDMVIQPNMIFTIEPGIYIPGKLGIRLEHMVLVKENDAEVIAFTPLIEAI